jgi:hypothetical protein
MPVGEAIGLTVSIGLAGFSIGMAVAVLVLQRKKRGDE